MDAALSVSNVPGQATVRERYGADVEHVREREFESTKEARTPTQETPEAEKSSLSLSEFKNVKERPTQESENAKSDITDTSVKDEEFMTSDKDARTPAQETTEAEKPSLTLSEFENVKERPTQESENAKSDITDTTVNDQEFITLDKDARTPRQETTEAEKRSLTLSEFENVKERPTQESENAKSDIADTSIKDQEYIALDKDARMPTKETTKAEKPSLTLSEFENVKEKPFQESENPLSSIADSPAVEGEFMKETPVQESEEQTGKKEELKDHPEGGIRHVFQEGDLKGFNIKDEPLQETEEPSDKEPKVEIEEQRDGRGEQPFQETHGPGKPQEAEAEETMKQVKHGEEDHEALSGWRPLQESASSNVETESWKEEALPTQETMAAGKGPFEETGEAQGPEAEKTRQVKEVEKFHKEFTEGKPLQQSTSSDVKTESCKEEALPTQETMTAGEGPFEETWFELGFKRQPTDECTDEEE